MKTEKDSGVPERIELTCGTCSNNDDGICDILGKLVDDDDKPHCSGGWERRE